MTQHGTLLKDDNGYPTNIGTPKNITTQTTTLVKTGAGFLYAIVFNKPVATGTVEYDDAVTNTNPMGTVTVPSNPQPFTLVINAAFATGLSITTGVAAQDITVIYR
jgi:hypothetical protein